MPGYLLSGDVATEGPCEGCVGGEMARHHPTLGDRGLPSKPAPAAPGVSGRPGLPLDPLCGSLHRTGRPSGLLLVGRACLPL